MTFRSLFLAFLVFPATAAAQQPGEAPSPDAAAIEQSAAAVQEEMAATQALIEAMQKRLENINAQGSGQEQELEFLQSKVVEAISQIAGDTEDPAQRTAETEAALQALNKARDEINALATREDVTVSELRGHIASLSNLLTAERQTTILLKDERSGLDDRLKAIRGRNEALESELATIVSRHEEQIAARDRAIAELKATLDQDARSLDFALDDLSQKDVTIAALEQRTADQERRISAQAEDLSRALGDVEALTSELSVLRDRLAAATQDLGQAQDTLADRDAALDAQEARIAELDRKLTAALAQEVTELKRYRSEFFGRLRAALGDRPDVRIVGDRFVLQAEVLFDSGSAELDQRGSFTLGQLAETLREVTSDIPDDVNWILRIDGHTDRVPISTGRFPSNWELSAARAISVLRFLVRQGVPADRLGAMGFGEHQPLDAREDEIAYRRNRRIEFKLTQR